MGRGERAQVSMEYLLVTGFALLLLFPIIIIAYSQSATFSDDVTAAQLEKVGNEIASAADTVYYAGAPTKKTIKVYFPKNVRDVSISGNTIVFTAGGQGGEFEYAVFSEANMTGSLGTFDGIHVITLIASETQVNITEQ